MTRKDLDQTTIILLEKAKRETSDASFIDAINVQIMEIYESYKTEEQMPHNLPAAYDKAMQ